MRACKKDKNHDEIAAAIRAVGLRWIDTFWSGGRLLDGIAINPNSRAMMFVEIKVGPKAKLTDDEHAFCKTHLGYCMVIWSVEQVRELRAMI